MAQIRSVRNHTDQYLRAHLGQVLDEVQAGDEVTILRDERPVARMAPAAAPAPRTFGMMRFEVPDDFDAPPTQAELAAWE